MRKKKELKTNDRHIKHYQILLRYHDFILLEHIYRAVYTYKKLNVIDLTFSIIIDLTIYKVPKSLDTPFVYVGQNVIHDRLGLITKTA